MNIKCFDINYIINNKLNIVPHSSSGHTVFINLVMYSYKVNVIATSITTLLNLGTVPLYNPLIPSFFHIYIAQSIEPLYSFALSPCIFVLITSTGVLANTEAAPAIPPPKNVHQKSGSPHHLRTFLDSDKVKNLIP